MTDIRDTKAMNEDSELNYTANLLKKIDKQKQQIKELKETINKAKKHLEIVAGSGISMSAVYRILNKH